MGNKDNIGDNGCGPIATYNAMILLEDYNSIPDIIKYYDSNSLSYLSAGGEYGLFLPAIGEYFKDKGYVVQSRCSQDLIFMLMRK